MSTTLTTPIPEGERPHRVGAGVLEPRQVLDALPGAFLKLDPRTLWRNPVMFIVEIGAALSTAFTIENSSVFGWLIAVWLWLTVVFANLAEAVAEGRGKAQAETLRRTRTHTVARRITGWTPAADPASLIAEDVPASALRLGDHVVVEAGQVIPGDGDVVEGIASVDESAITGESAPVIRESGGDRSSVTGGTTVLSDRIVVEVTSKPGETFIDRMIALVEGASRQKTPNEIALNILLASLTIIFMLAVVTLQPFATYSKTQQPVTILVALLVCLIPTTIGALLSAIGIAGMDRLVQRNVLAMSGRAVEAAGDVNTLLLDKTGTITLGNRQASEILPVGDTDVVELADAAQLSSLSDETPEGRSVVVYVKVHHGLRERTTGELSSAHFVPFTAQTRMSGVDLADGRQIRKGAAAAVVGWVHELGGDVPSGTGTLVDGISAAGGTPLLVGVNDSHGARVLGVIHLKDVVKDGIRTRFDELRRMGIRTVMITGDNPLTARAIAAEAGVDDFLAEATPEDKIALIRREQEGGRLVAMTGDGTNDAPALAQADVGVAMNSGTSAAKEAGNMVDLDSDPTKLIEIVEIGKQLLITRGSLTTFSIANDVAKYFAILPAMFVGTFPGLHRLNIMALHSPESAILSAVIFNALVIIALIPLALRGVRYMPSSASSMLRRNLAIYGVGGLVVPFIGIKVVDLVVQFLPGIR
jgi:potassium-transporting ATPase ATP-binding subunit